MNYLKFKLHYFSIAALLTGSYFINKRKIIYNLELPTITRREVMNHREKENRIWITYKDGVYDITDFIPVHPGGEEKILLGAGGALEPFWEMYAFHKKEDVLDILKKYKIGNLHPNDIIEEKNIPNFDFLKNDKINRSPYLKTHHKFPFCAEGPNEIIDNFYTPSDYFFIRNHNGIPQIDHENYNIKFVSDNKVFDFTLDDLKKYKEYTIDSIIMCTGNRRKHLNDESSNKSRGIEWDTGAIGNGKWTGTLLRDILESHGYNKENIKGLHLISSGYDKDFQGVYFNTSIPLEFAYETDVILAYRYNDQDIPFEHGYPVRLIIPGVVGIRNTKWLKSLEISKNESNSSYQQKDYKHIPKEEDWEKVDFKKYKPIYYLSVNSAIVKPKQGDIIKDEKIDIKGYAMGHKGAKISKIEISLDHGNTWKEIENLKYNIQNGKNYGWTLWEDTIDTKTLGEYNLWVRAQDENGNSQPVTTEFIWNIRGLMNNSVHKVKFNRI